MIVSIVNLTNFCWVSGYDLVSYVVLKIFTAFHYLVFHGDERTRVILFR